MARGGARVGAGRRPKALVYKEEVAAAEASIVGDLPRLLGKLSEMAMEGDLGALKYLVDRVLGRVPVLRAVPAADTSLQYTQREFEGDLEGHLLRMQVRKEERDRVMCEMDLEGTELEYEFEAQEGGDGEGEEEEVGMDGEDIQDELEEDEEEEFNMDEGDGGDVQEEEIGEEIHIDGQDVLGADSAEVSSSGAVEEASKAEAVSADARDEEEGREPHPNPLLGKERGPDGGDGEEASSTEGQVRPLPPGYGRWLPPSGRMGFAV